LDDPVRRASDPHARGAERRRVATDLPSMHGDVSRVFAIAPAHPNARTAPRLTVRLRLFAEILARETAARAGFLTSATEDQVETGDAGIDGDADAGI
jgi:hypothetical protein